MNTYTHIHAHTHTHTYIHLYTHTYIYYVNIFKVVHECTSYLIIYIQYIYNGIHTYTSSHTINNNTGRKLKVC